MNRELPDVQAGFRKAEEPEIKLPTSAGSSKIYNGTTEKSLNRDKECPKTRTFHTEKRNIFLYKK